MMVVAVAALSGCDRTTVAPAAAERSGDSARGEPPAGTLGRQIVVDPARLARNGNAHASARDATGRCAFAYDAAWARRLPAGLPLYPGARLVEAAGSDAPGCRRRVIAFTTAATPAAVIAFYRKTFAAAGFSAEHVARRGADVLGGTKGEAAYLLTVTPTAAGATVDLASNAS